MKIFLYFCFLITFSFSYSSGRLVFLYTHFRHGARGPKQLDENYIDRLGEKWTNLGELTGVGERMHYLLGLKNRKKYIEEDGLISEKFDPHQILIFTSDKNRTMLSCYSQLQGLFPQRENLGEELSIQQEANAYPPILDNIEEKDADIEKAINELNSSALPYSMMLAPARMVNENEIKMNVHDIGECAEKTDKLKDENLKIQELKDVTNQFNEKYAKKLNKYFNKEKAKFKAKTIKKICNDFLSDYTDNRNMAEFKEKTGLDFKILKQDCLDFYKQYYIYAHYGDEGKLIAHIESSKIMRELLFYMKRRLDTDISDIDEDSHYEDYSRPRWLMISGHESTVSADLVIIIKALGLDMKTAFHFPRFASQLALEVRTDKEKCENYKDYYIVGYFDNDEIFNVRADEFINKIENEIWTNQQVDEYCGFYSKSDDIIDNNAYKILFIISSCLIAVLLVIVIFLGYKLYKANHLNDLKKSIDNTSSIVE